MTSNPTNKRPNLSYNPEDVNIRVQFFRIFEILKMLDKGTLELLNNDLFNNLNSFRLQYSLFNLDEIGDDIDLDIETPFELQRNPALWNRIQQSRFIESLMIKLPIPVFYFDGSQNPWRVVDGLQRLYTIKSFINGEFKLTGLEYLVKECEKKYYNSQDFPGYLRARILDSEIIAFVINPGTPQNVKYNIFKRINTGGLRLTGQEIRNSFFHGTPSEFVKKLARSQSFIEATNQKVSSRRMLDSEYVNRFVAFQLFGFKEYNGKMDNFLSEAMISLYDLTSEELDKLEQNFNEASNRVLRFFKRKGFYRPKENGKWGKSPNKAIFDTLSYNILTLDANDYNYLLHPDFINRYFKFMNSHEMFRAINDTTSSKTSVTIRFNEMSKFLKGGYNDF